MGCVFGDFAANPDLSGGKAHFDPKGRQTGCDSYHDEHESQGNHTDRPGFTNYRRNHHDDD